MENTAILNAVGKSVDKSIAGPAYFVDEEDPRASTTDVWNQMSEAERAAVIDALPSDFPPSEKFMPEGDLHFNTKVYIRRILGDYYQRIRRNIYLACALPIYYSGEAMFAPDIMAVLDVRRAR